MAALSQRTKNIRLGHGIVLTPPNYNHPARIAERISALDLLSDGRVEFGTGESASDMELGGFDVERGMKKAMWEESTREITKMMTQEPYDGFEGEFFSMPSRNVVPKPRQKPHPPLWVAASRRETTMVAARFGMGSLGFGFETPEELGDRANEYYRLVREECMPIGQAINPALAALNTFMIGPSDEEALKRSAGGPGFFSYSLGYYYNPATGGKHQPGTQNLYKQYRDSSSEGAAEVQAARGGFLTETQIREGEPEEEVQRALYPAARSGNAIGTVDSVRETLKLYEDQHLDTMIFVAQAGDRKHEHIMESIQEFGTKVMPEFKERHETVHRSWREEQLAGVEFPINSSI